MLHIPYNSAWHERKHYFLERRLLRVTDDEKNPERPSFPTQVPGKIAGAAREEIESTGIPLNPIDKKDSDIEQAHKIRERLLTILVQSEQLDRNDFDFLLEQLSYSDGNLAQDVRQKALKRFAVEWLAAEKASASPKEKELLLSAAQTFLLLRSELFTKLVTLITTKHTQSADTQLQIDYLDKKILVEAAISGNKNESDALYKFLAEEAQHKDFAVIKNDLKNYHEMNHTGEKQFHMMPESYIDIFAFPLSQLIEELDDNELKTLFELLTDLRYRQGDFPHMRNEYLRRHLTGENLQKLQDKIADVKIFDNIIGNVQTVVESDFSLLKESLQKKLDDATQIGEDFGKTWELAREAYYDKNREIDRTKPLFNVFKANQLFEDFSEIAKNISSPQDFEAMQAKRDELFTSIQENIKPEDTAKKEIMLELLQQVDEFLTGAVRYQSEEVIKTQAAEISARFEDQCRLMGQSLADILAYQDNPEENPDDASGMRSLSQHATYYDAALKVAKSNRDELGTLEDLRALQDATSFVQYSEEERKRVDVPKNKITTEAIPPEVTEAIDAIVRYGQQVQADALKDPFQDPIEFAKKWGYDIKVTTSGAASAQAYRVLAQPYTALSEGLSNGYTNNPFISEALQAAGFENIIPHLSIAEDNMFFRDFVRLKSVKGAILQSVAEQAQRTTTTYLAKLRKFVVGEKIDNSEITDRFEQLRQQGRDLYHLDAEDEEALRDELISGQKKIEEIYKVFAEAPHSALTEDEKVLTEKANPTAEEQVQIKEILAKDKKTIAERQAKFRQITSLREYYREVLTVLDALHLSKFATEDKGDIMAVMKALEASVANAQKNTSRQKLTPQSVIDLTNKFASAYGLESPDPGIELTEDVKNTLVEEGNIEVVPDAEWQDESADSKIVTAADGKQKVQISETAWKGNAQELASAKVHEQVHEVRFTNALQQKSEDEKQAVEQQLSQLKFFATWLGSDSVLDADQKEQFAAMTNPDGRKVLQIVPDSALNPEEPSRFETTKTGFVIKIKQSVWDSDNLSFLSNALRHEGLHAIDEASSYAVSTQLFKLLNNEGSGLSEFYRQFTERLQTATHGKNLDSKEIKKEFFVYLFSKSLFRPNDAAEAAALQTFLANNKIILDTFREGVFAEAVNNFTKNGIRHGWWNPGDKLSYVTIAEEKIEDVGLNDKNPDTFKFQYNQRRRRILKKLEALQKFKPLGSRREDITGNVHDILTAAEALLSKRKIADQEFEDMINKLKDTEKEMDGVLANIAYNYTKDEGFARDLWNNTTFLALADFRTIFTTTKEFIVRRHERNSKRRAGVAGKAFFNKFISPLGNEFDNVREKSETDAVNAYKEQLSNKDSWQIMDRVDSSANTDELKACLYLLSERGAIDWNDTRIWRAFEKYQGSIVFFESDTDNPEFLRSKFQRACGILYDNDYFRDIDRKNASSFESTKQEYKEETSQNLDHMDQIVSQMLVDKISGKKKVSPHRYEMYIDAAINLNKSNPIKVFWWILEGINLGILNMERVTQLDTKYQNLYPMTNWFTNVNPTSAQVRQIGNLFKPGSDGGMPENFKDWFQTEVIGNKAVQERMRKSASDKVLDHDWAFVAGSVGDAGTAKFLLAVNAGLQGRLPKTGIPNVIAGQLHRITTIAREYKSDHIQNKALLREQLAAHIEYVFTFNAIFKGRLNHPSYYGNSPMRDMYIGSEAEMRTQPREKNIYCKKPKSTLEFMDSNDDIIKQLDPKLFSIIEGGALIQPEQVEELATHLRSIGIPEDKIPTSAPDIGQKMSGIALEIMEKDNNAFDRIMNTAIKQYKNDHPGESENQFIHTYTYPTTESLTVPHEGYPVKDRGFLGLE